MIDGGRKYIGNSTCMTHVPYEKLQIWQKSINLVRLVYGVTRRFPKEEIYGITSQIRRASISVPSNIAEGSQRKSARDFGHFIEIAKGSLAELHTQLIIAHDLQYLSSKDKNDLCLCIEELQKMLFCFLHRMPKQIY